MEAIELNVNTVTPRFLQFRVLETWRHPASGADSPQGRNRLPSPSDDSSTRMFPPGQAVCSLCPDAAPVLPQLPTTGFCIVLSSCTLNPLLQNPESKPISLTLNVRQSWRSAWFPAALLMVLKIN